MWRWDLECEGWGCAGEGNWEEGDVGCGSHFLVAGEWLERRGVRRC